LPGVFFRALVEFVLGVISLSSSLFDLTSLWSVVSDLRKELKDEHTAYVVDVDAVISQLGSGNLGLANQVVRWMLPSLTSLVFQAW